MVQMFTIYTLIIHARCIFLISQLFNSSHLIVGARYSWTTATRMVSKGTCGINLTHEFIWTSKPPSLIGYIFSYFLVPLCLYCANNVMKLLRCTATSVGGIMLYYFVMHFLEQAACRKCLDRRTVNENMGKIYGFP